MAEATSRRPLWVVLALGVVALVFISLVLFVVPLGSPDGGGRTTVGGHPLFGKAAPEIGLKTLEGQPISLSELKGRPVLVNFWATWCPPCQAEFPLLVQAYADHAADGLEILGITHNDFAPGARAFADDMGAHWPILEDPDDVAYDDFIVPAVPTSYFIDAEGIVRAFSFGGFSEAGLAAQLAKILPPDEVPSPS